MHVSVALAERILHTAIEVVEKRDAALLAALDELPAAIYLTNTEGVVTYFNRACIDFSGRTPAVGKDRWCVTWKLYTEDGAFLPHDQCPMALAIRQKRAIRGIAAVAERPDGSRVNFIPYPTPLLDENGALRGAVNMLIDVTDSKQAEFLQAQARKCRRLARAVNDQPTAETLTIMAAEYEQKALRLLAQ